MIVQKGTGKIDWWVFPLHFPPLIETFWHGPIDYEPLFKKESSMLTVEEAITLLGRIDVRGMNIQLEEAFDLLCKEARLGALVREMPDDAHLIHEKSHPNGEWEFDVFIFQDGAYDELSHWGSTPEAALLSAKPPKGGK